MSREDTSSSTHSEDLSSASDREWVPPSPEKESTPARERSKQTQETRPRIPDVSRDRERRRDRHERQRDRRRERTGQRASEVSTQHEEDSGPVSGDRPQTSRARKSRKTRFTEAESCVLVDAVEASYHLLYGKRAHATSAAQKRKIWDAIAEKVAACSGMRRDVRTCQKRYSDCRRQTKRKMADEARSAKETGGGPPFQHKWSSWENILKRSIQPVDVQGDPALFDSRRAGHLPMCQEEPARKQRSKRRSEGTPASRTSAARGTSPDRGASTGTSNSRSMVTAVPAQKERSGLVHPDDMAPGSLFESSGVSDVTFQGFESSRAEDSLPSQELSQEARPESAPGEPPTPAPEATPSTSTGRASGIGPYFRPNLLDVPEEDDDDDDQPASRQPTAIMPTALRAQVRTVHHLQRGRVEEGLDLVGSLASQMNEEHSTFRDVVNDRLLAIEIEQRRTADGLKDLHDLIAAEGRARHEEHQQLMGVLTILATSTAKLVENSACQQQVSQSIELSQRNSAISLESMAAALKLISETLPGMSQQLAGLHPPHPPPQPPPPAPMTPSVQPGTTSWYGRSQQYTGYAGQYPVMPPPAAQQTAQKSSRRKKRRKKRSTTSTSTSEQEADTDKEQQQ